MRTGWKLIAIGFATVVAVAGIALYATLFLAYEPPSQAATIAAPGRADLTLQTVASMGTGAHPDWVSYLVESRGRWVHSTVFRVPRDSLVHVTIYQYDTATGLRNPFFAQPQGVVGGVMTVDGKVMHRLAPADASHTFAIPDLHVSVPLKGVDDNAKNQCSAAPCTLQQAHTTVTFTFRTHGPGNYRWQCFVPCALQFYFGNGGPMQTLGYMDGYLEVV